MSWEQISFLVLIVIVVFSNVVHWRGANPWNLIIPPSRIMVFLGSIVVLYLSASFLWELPGHDFWPGPGPD